MSVREASSRRLIWTRVAVEILSRRNLSFDKLLPSRCISATSEREKEGPACQYTRCTEEDVFYSCVCYIYVLLA